MAYMGRKMWLTLAQMESRPYFNSKEDAELIAKDCDERPHELPSMRAAGKVQFHVEVTEEIWKRVNQDKVDLCAEGKIDAQQYKRVKEEMDKDACGSKRSAAKKVKVEPTEDEKKAAEEKALLKEAQKECNTSLAAAKRVGDKVKTDLKAALQNCSKLQDKGYPKAMQTHYESKINPVKTEAEALIDVWSDAQNI